MSNLVKSEKSKGKRRREPTKEPAEQPKEASKEEVKKVKNSAALATFFDELSKSETGIFRPARVHEYKVEKR